jgi:diadenosine tetraphosphate (Ap4A) HIT family hydrolase
MFCPFCDNEELEIIKETKHLVAFRDKFPVCPGHTLVVPRRHVSSFFEMTDDEKGEIFQLVDIIKDGLEIEFRPDGYNIGWNDGAAAGQTVFHFHLHIIPRYEGDVEDPRGGVRWVVSSRAKYWDD